MHKLLVSLKIERLGTKKKKGFTVLVSDGILLSLTDNGEPDRNSYYKHNSSMQNKIDMEKF